MSNENILPDCRLHDKSKLSVMADYVSPSGKVTRIEWIPAFCSLCHEQGPYFPRDNTTFAYYLCQKCYDENPTVEGTWATPDDQFCRDVAYEMERLHGRQLTSAEIVALDMQGRLGRWLELLAKESPYPVYEQEP